MTSDNNYDARKLCWMTLHRCKGWWKRGIWDLSRTSTIFFSSGRTYGNKRALGTKSISLPRRHSFCWKPKTNINHITVVFRSECEENTVIHLQTLPMWRCIKAANAMSAFDCEGNYEPLIFSSFLNTKMSCFEMLNSILTINTRQPMRFLCLTTMTHFNIANGCLTKYSLEK